MQRSFWSVCAGRLSNRSLGGSAFSGPRLPSSGARIQAGDELLFLLVGVREDHCAFEPDP